MIIFPGANKHKTCGTYLPAPGLPTRTRAGRSPESCIMLSWEMHHEIYIIA